MAILYLVSTPIGNLGDLSPRAREVLAGVSRILAEDTRRTRPLLNHLGLTTGLVSLHAHNESARREEVLSWLDAGEDLALVSDAGTPLVSDPGERVVTAALVGGHNVVPVPGPSAILAALVASGLPTGRFTFLGFPPRKGPERKALLDRASAANDTTILFESPERLVKLLRDLAAVCRDDRRAAVARELTKLHEEFVRGTLAELVQHFSSHSPRGEITLVLEGGAEDKGASPEVDRAAVMALARVLLAEGMTPSRTAKEVARRLRLPRNLVYEVVQALGGGGGPDDERDP
jgi:16S rRNA (cytidine1402-2'-O)-methyltransferase